MVNSPPDPTPVDQALEDDEALGDDQVVAGATPGAFEHRSGPTGRTEGGGRHPDRYLDVAAARKGFARFRRGSHRHRESWGCWICSPARRCIIATAHLLYGSIGAGKTTYAARLAADHNAIRFTVDEWVAGLYGRDGAGIPDFDLQSERIRDVMEPIWSRCLVLGVDVVLDIGIWRRVDRDRTRAIVERHGAETRLYWLDCSEQEARRRTERRNADPRGSVVLARNTFDVLRSRIEPLDADEPHVVITT